MMSEWISAALDLTLILMVAAGLFQAARLIKHLQALKQGRIDMERFVREFNGTVIRAEAGIKGLRQAARDSGDDLEKLVEKANLLRDELSFIVESADQVAERLSKSASTILRPEIKAAAAKTPEPNPPATAASSSTHTATAEPVAPLAARKPDDKNKPATASRAEQELMQALRKLS